MIGTPGELSLGGDFSKARFSGRRSACFVRFRSALMAWWLGGVRHNDGILRGDWKAWGFPFCLVVQPLETGMRFDQEQHSFEDFLPLDGVRLLEQLTMKLAQSIDVCDDRPPVEPKWEAPPQTQQSSTLRYTGYC